MRITLNAAEMDLLLKARDSYRALPKEKREGRHMTPEMLTAQKVFNRAIGILNILYRDLKQTGRKVPGELTIWEDDSGEIGMDY